MARRSAIQAIKTNEPASLPEVLISPSQAKTNEKDAYWIQLLQEPDQFKAAIATEDFFPMLKSFPEAIWERLSIYLYRLTDDRGMMIRNAPDQKGYLPGGVLHHAIEEEDVVRKWGGGKFRAYLKLDTRLALREHVFYIDAPPKVLSGQVVEVGGKEVPLGPAAPAAPADDGNAVSKVIDASAKANESAMGILAHASATAIDMVKAQATQANAPQRNPLDDVKTLLEIVKPARDPFQEKLLEVLMTRAFAPPPVVETEPRETPFDETVTMIEKVTGKPLSETMKGSKAVADATPGWVGPLLSAAGNFIDKLPLILQQQAENRRLEFERQVYLANMQAGKPATLPAPTEPPRAAAPPMQPPAQPAPATPPAAPDPGQLMHQMVVLICEGFDKHPVGRWGEQCAAKMDMDYSELIEAFGIEAFLADPVQMKEFVAGHPELKRRSEDPRWTMFFEDFTSYTMQRWGAEEEDAEDSKGETSA